MRQPTPPLIEGMDKSLGDLMDWLEKNGEADNTIILFMSDNGGLASTSEWRDGPLYTQNYPLLSGKGSLCEGGIREPMIVSWPGSSPTEYPLRQIPADRRLLPDYPGNGRSEGLRDGATYRRHQLRSSAHRDGRSFQRAFLSSGICRTTGATTVRASTSTVRSAMATGN